MLTIKKTQNLCLSYEQKDISVHRSLAILKKSGFLNFVLKQKQILKLF